MSADHKKDDPIDYHPVAQGAPASGSPHPAFDLEAFRHWAMGLLNDVLKQDPPPMFGVDPQVAVRRFEATVRTVTTLGEWTEAATGTLLQPVGQLLLYYYRGYLASVDEVNRLSRLGYERLYEAVVHILGELANALGEPAPVFAEFGAPCDQSPVRIAHDVTAYIRTVRRDAHPDQLYIFWTMRPGRRDAQGNILEKAEVIVW